VSRIAIEVWHISGTAPESEAGKRASDRRKAWRAKLGLNRLALYLHGTACSGDPVDMHVDTMRARVAPARWVSGAPGLSDPVATDRGGHVLLGHVGTRYAVQNIMIATMPFPGHGVVKL